MGGDKVLIDWETANAALCDELDRSRKETAALKEELRVTEALLTERERLLNAVPECTAHGPGCVPHAIQWVDMAKDYLGETVITIRRCGNCKHLGEEITLDGDERNDWQDIKTGFFKCNFVKNDENREYQPGSSAILTDGLHWITALCVEPDFGCVKWEEKC